MVKIKETEGLLTKELRDTIDKLTQEEMARLWRYSPPGHEYFLGEVGEYFIKKFNEKGGFTSTISKQIDNA